MDRGKREAMLREMRALRHRLNEASDTAEQVNLKQRYRTLESELAHEEPDRTGDPRYTTTGVIADTRHNPQAYSYRRRRVDRTFTPPSDTTPSTFASRYAVLRILSYVFFSYGIISLVVAVVLAGANTVSAPPLAGMRPAPALIAGVFAFTGFTAIAALMRLAADVGDNTRRTAEALETLAARK